MTRTAMLAFGLCVASLELAAMALLDVARAAFLPGHLHNRGPILVMVGLQILTGVVIIPFVAVAAFRAYGIRISVAAFIAASLGAVLGSGAVWLLSRTFDEGLLQSPWIAAVWWLLLATGVVLTTTLIPGARDTVAQ